MTFKVVRLTAAKKGGKEKSRRKSSLLTWDSEIILK